MKSGFVCKHVQHICSSEVLSLYSSTRSLSFFGGLRGAPRSGDGEVMEDDDDSIPFLLNL